MNSNFCNLFQPQNIYQAVQFQRRLFYVIFNIKICEDTTFYNHIETPLERDQHPENSFLFEMFFD